MALSNRSISRNNSRRLALLLASTALAGGGLTATPAMAQSINPAGGGTVSTSSGTISGGGVNEGVNVQQSGGGGVTVTNVNITNTGNTPTVDGLRVTGQGGVGVGVGVAGSSTITSQSGNGITLQGGSSENIGFGVDAGQTLNVTGVNGISLTGNQNLFLANPGSVGAITATARTNGSGTGILISTGAGVGGSLGRVSVTGFATGIGATGNGLGLTVEGGSITATNTGIGLNSSSNVILDSQSAIVASTGINISAATGATVTTSGAGTIDSTGVGIGTGIIATSSGGTGTIGVTIGAAIGGTTAFAKGVDVSRTGTSTGALAITTTAAVTGTSVGITLSRNATATTANTVIIGADVTGGTGIDGFSAATTNFTVQQGATVTGTSSSTVGLHGFGSAGIVTNSSLATVTNSGTIQSTGTGVGNAGVLNLSGAATTNTATGVITGRTGIYDSNGVVTTNGGTITGTGTAATEAGVRKYGGTLTNTGNITSAADGVLSVANVFTLNNLGGTITGATNGIEIADGFLRLVNTGTVQTAGGTAGAGLAGVYLNVSSTASNQQITNSGTISGGGDATHGFGIDVKDGVLSLTNQSGGNITGGAGAIRLANDDADTINLNAGSTVTGQILSTNSGARNVTLAGTLTGNYNAGAGTGINAFTLASTGSMQGAAFGSANDTFTFQGGTIGGVINANGGTDTFNSALGAGNSASLNMSNLTGFESYNHLSGILTLSGSRNGGPVWNVAANTTLNLAGSLTNVTGSGFAITASTPSTVNVLSTGLLNDWVGIYFNGPSTNTVSNAGSITGVAGGIATVSGAINLTNSGSITSTASNAVALAYGPSTVVNTGTITSSGASNYGVSSYFGPTTITNNAGAITGGAGGVINTNGSLTVVNAATISGTGATSSGLSSGGSSLSITNQSGGVIAGFTHGVNVTAGSLSLTNAGTIGTGTVSGGVFTAGGSGDGISISGGTGNVIDNRGTISGGRGIASTIALALTNRGTVTGTSATQAGVDTSGAASVITNYGTIQGGTQAIVLNNGGRVYNLGTGSVLQAVAASGSSDASGIYSNGPLSLVNEGAITSNSTGRSYGIQVLGVGSISNSGSITATDGASGIVLDAGGSILNTGSITGAAGGIKTNGGTLTLVNLGTITSRAVNGLDNDDALFANGATTVLNAGTMTTDAYAAVIAYNGTTTVTNAAVGHLTGGNQGAVGVAVNLAAGGTFTNYGQASSTGGHGVYSASNANSTVVLMAGSATGDILLTDGNDTLSLYNGRGTAGAATTTTYTDPVTGAVGSVTLQNAGNLAAASFGAIDLGGGTNTLMLRGGGDGTAANGAAGSFALSTSTGASILTKADSGTWTLTGAAITPALTINAGTGGTPGSGGLLIFNGTSGLTGDIYVNGATIRANTAGAFGTGTIHAIDPTIQYAASGAYANDISLEVPTPASADPTILQSVGNNFIILTGAITSGTGLGVDPNQPLTFDGPGTFDLTNAANNWSGTTTISGATSLLGRTDTISGTDIVNNGTLSYSQDTDGIVSQAISGSGGVVVDGSGNANTITFSGNNSVAGGFASYNPKLAFTGSNSSAGTVVFLNSANAQLDVAAGGSLNSTAASAVRATQANATVNNLGTISGAGANQATVQLGQGGTVNNGSMSNAAASISGTYAAIGSYGANPLTVNNYGTASAGDFGIFSFTQSTQINNSGTINTTNAGGQAISLSGGGNVSNLAGGLISGAYSVLSFAGNLSVDNAGTMTGEILGQGPLALVNRAGGTISNAVTTVFAGNGATVTNAGAIRSTNSQALALFGGSVSVANQAGGTISGVTGINATTLTLANAGQIVGSSTALTATGVSTVVNDGLIGSGTLIGATFTASAAGTGTGINLGNATSDTVTNNASGTISGGQNALFAASSVGSLNLTNAGTIRGGSFGIFTQAAGSNLTNQAGGSISGVTGINATTLTLGNAGQIVGSSTALTATGVSTVVNDGLIGSGTLIGGVFTRGTNSGNAVTLAGGTVTNNNGGQITSGTGWSGIAFTGGAGTVNNNAGATITGGSSAIFSQSGVTSTSITNAGTMTADTNAAVYITTGALTLNNQAGGTIRSNGSYAVYNGGSGASSVTNAGTITGLTGTSSFTPAVYLVGANSNVTNQAGGTITGRRGVETGGVNGTILNAGTITATFDNAISLLMGGTATNQASGTLNANGATGAWGIFTSGAAATITNAGTINAGGGIVTNFSGTTVDNSGAINGQLQGVWAYGGTLALTNSGTIGASNGYGVQMGEGGSVINLSGGTIGGSSGAILLAGAGGYILDLRAGSTVNGTIQAGSTSGTNTTLLAGALNGGYVGGSGADNFTLFDTGAFSGRVDGGAAIDTFTLAGNGSSAVDGSRIVNFENLVKTGTGSRILDGTNTSFTDIQVQQGTLAVSGGNAINDSALVTVATPATLALLSSEAIGGLAGSGAVTLGANTLTLAGPQVTGFSGVISGTGGLTRAGAGTITLSGINTYTGMTRVASGTLALGASNVIADASMAVVDAGSVLDLGQFSDTVASAAIAGTINGTGTLTAAQYQLNGASVNANLGDGSLFQLGGISLLNGTAGAANVVVNAGTLRLGGAERLGNTAALAIASGGVLDLAGFQETVGTLEGGGSVALGAGRLTLNQLSSTLFSGAITGTGGLTKSGNGTLNLTGASSYIGSTLVNGGTLAVNGSLASAVTVNSGGTLGGNGSVGALSVLSGGILAPGNTIGHLIVAGNLNFAPGSIYQVEVTPTASDSTSATGNITIGGGTVQVLATGAAYNPLTRYTILDADGSVSGAFTNVTSNLAFLTPGIEYNPKSVVLVLRRNNIIFADVAVNPNQVGVANAVQSIGISPLYDAVLAQSADGARQAYDALSGEVYASSATAILGKGHRLQDAMASNRLRADGLSLWGDAGRSWGSFESSASRGNAFGSTDTTDLLGGLNWRRGMLSATVAGGHVDDELSINARASETKAKSWLFGGQFEYGTALGLRAVVGGNYAWHKVATNRAIVFPGFAETASSNRNGRGYHLFGEVGYAVNVSGVTVEPFAGLQRDQLELDGLSEQGGLAALNVQSASRHLGTSQIGVKLASSANLGWATFTPRASVAWQHVMGDRVGRMDAGLQAGGVDYSVAGAALARNGAKVVVDMDLDLGAATVVAGYSGVFGGVAAEHTAKISAQFRF